MGTVKFTANITTLGKNRKILNIPKEYHDEIDALVDEKHKRVSVIVSTLD
jgi:hypothetical protein